MEAFQAEPLIDGNLPVSPLILFRRLIHWLTYLQISRNVFVFVQSDFAADVQNFLEEGVLHFKLEVKDLEGVLVYIEGDFDLLHRLGYLVDLLEVKISLHILHLRFVHF